VLRPGYPLETGRLVLRPFEPGDLEGLFAFHSLPEVARFLYWEARDHWLSRRHRQGERGWGCTG
jgi:RimJ/RimL family protein N-acetyltransferase